MEVRLELDCSISINVRIINYPIRVFPIGMMGFCTNLKANVWKSGFCIVWGAWGAPRPPHLTIILNPPLPTHTKTNVIPT